MIVRAVLAICVAAGLAGTARAETSDITALATTEARPLLIESVARGADGGLLVSSIHTARIYRLAADGGLSPFGPEAEQAVFGMVADPARNALWTAVSPADQDTVEDVPAALVRRDLTTGAVVARYPAPEPADPFTPPDLAHVFGDVVLGPDGAVFVADTASGEIFVLRPDEPALSLLAELGADASPQGMAVSPDGTALVVASYSAGLYRISLDGGAPMLIPPPLEMELRGIDGMALHGADLIAIQNGTRTQRILRLTFDPLWFGVTDRQVLSEAPLLVEPTTGFIENDALILVARSQWRDFDQNGAPTSQTPDGAVIGRLPLAPPPRYLCLTPGSFRLEADEEIAGETGSIVHITSPRGDLDLHRQTFSDDQPEIDSMVAGMLMGIIYRTRRPSPGYALSMLNPMQDGQMLLAWVSGSALTGGAEDAAIYGRFQLLPPQLPCYRRWDD